MHGYQVRRRRPGRAGNRSGEPLAQPAHRRRNAPKRETADVDERQNLRNALAASRRISNLRLPNMWCSPGEQLAPDIAPLGFARAGEDSGGGEGFSPRTVREQHTVLPHTRNLLPRRSPVTTWGMRSPGTYPDRLAGVAAVTIVLFRKSLRPVGCLPIHVPRDAASRQRRSNVVAG